MRQRKKETPSSIFGQTGDGTAPSTPCVALSLSFPHVILYYSWHIRNTHTLLYHVHVNYSILESSNRRIFNVMQQFQAGLALLLRSSLKRVSASSTPRHASRSTRSSCNPRDLPACPFVWGPPSAVLGSVLFFGRPTPSAGGINPRGGAFIVLGAMRDWRMWASEERMANWMFC